MTYKKVMDMLPLPPVNKDNYQAPKRHLKFHHLFMKTSAEIRQAFFDFFKQKGHTIVGSAPIVIKNDPTLLFTNAGMNQFKDFFLGNKKPPFSRVADTQKCLRVSGKHNDLEEVGVDNYHHTMFEMLGNWSFGNAKSDPPPYFKEEAIAWSWELLTKVFDIPEDDLYVTVFEGSEKDGLPADDESVNYWKKWVPENHILPGNKKDNFWEMGDTGPCGPCTEIHFDARSEEEKKKVPGRELVNKDNAEVIEIWNNVFIQYDRKKDGSLVLLPAQHVDTGMGFERLVRVLQHKKSNYDTDIFTGTIEEVERISGKKYEGTQSRSDIAFRVIADHIRAVTFPIADGQLPSNTGAGYVIRRILRRAVRYYYTYLDVKEPLLFQLVPLLAKQFENVFSEVEKQKEFIARVIREEENSFLKTLGSGLKRLEAILATQKEIDGSTAFELFDTYGFPIDLTNLIASENNATIDMPGFEKEMQQQKDRSRAAAAMNKGDWNILQKNVLSAFEGYECMETESSIVQYRKTESQGKESYQVVLDKTPFYAESGGQVGDTGWLISGDEKIKVLDTKKENDLILHFTNAIPSDVSAPLVAKVDEEKRKNIMLHHSATHLMHAALRKVLGEHVAQKGSLVNENYLRFDFSHFAKVTPEEILKIEQLVNERIRKNDPVIIERLPKEEALQKGAMALFGEKYGDEVRVVTMDEKYSVELCGGTHVARTGDLGCFIITGETAVGAGVRRIEALSGKAAESFIESQLQLLHSLRSKLKNPKDTEKAIDQLLEENNQLKKSIEKESARQAHQLADQLKEKIKELNGIKYIAEVIETNDAGSIRKICNELRAQFDDMFILLMANVDGKASVGIGISDKLAKEKGLDASKIIKTNVAPLIKGGGGGNASLAAASGQDAEQFQKILQEVQAVIS